MPVTFKDEQPVRDFYWIFHDKDGSQKHYFTTMMDYMKYVSLYGVPEEMLWTYEPGSNKVYGKP